MQNISLPDPVLWHEGMSLLPHHFQQDFIYQQTVSSIQLQWCGVSQFGVIEMEIDTLSLVKNIFKINKIFAVMPDGVIVKIENHPNYNLEYQLPNPEEFDKSNLSVYLTIPKLISNNYFIGKYPRYKKEHTFDVPDFYSGEDPIEIAKMLPNIQIHSDIDLNSNFTTLKLAILSVDKNIWTLNSYVTASLKIGNDNPIYSLCSEITYSIRKKISVLSDLIHVRSENMSANFISENLFYAQGLGMGLPRLEGLLFSGQAHPFELYLALCGILGGLGLLTNSYAPPLPNIYQHEELLLTFEKMKLEIDKILNSFLDDNIQQVYFEQQDDIYNIEIQSNYLINKCLLIGFKKKLKCVDSSFHNWIKTSIICDTNKINITTQNRTLGLQRIQLDRTEEIIPAKNVYLYKIIPESVSFDLSKLSIFNYDDKENAPEDIFIFVKK
jgi:type VI secretion system protein ImpJ